MTNLSTHAPDHNDTPTMRHEFRRLEAGITSSHHIDIHELLDLGRGVFKRGEVLDDARGSHADLKEASTREVSMCGGGNSHRPDRTCL